jgi:hypothetical protein
MIQNDALDSPQVIDEGDAYKFELLYCVHQEVIHSHVFLLELLGLGGRLGHGHLCLLA